MIPTLDKGTLLEAARICNTWSKSYEVGSLASHFLALAAQQPASSRNRPAPDAAALPQVESQRDRTSTDSRISDPREPAAAAPDADDGYARAHGHSLKAAPPAASPKSGDGIAAPRHSLAAQENTGLAAEIANANRFDRKVFSDAYEFGEWAQSRARYYLAPPPPPASGETPETNALYSRLIRMEDTSFQPGMDPPNRWSYEAILEFRDHACQLERELADRDAQIAEAANRLHDELHTGGHGGETLRSIVDRAVRKYDRLQADLAKAIANHSADLSATDAQDAKRLDWLSLHKAGFTYFRPGVRWNGVLKNAVELEWRLPNGDYTFVDASTIRDAIDKAMNASTDESSKT